MTRGRLLPGLAALGAGVAWVVWAVINSRTNGGLDVGAAAVGDLLARVGALLMVAWNLLLLPAAIVLDGAMRKHASETASLTTLAGIVALAIVWDSWLAWILLARTPLAVVTQAPNPQTT